MAVLESTEKLPVFTYECPGSGLQVCFFNSSRKTRSLLHKLFCRKWPGSSCHAVKFPAVLKLKQVKNCTTLNQVIFLFSGVSEAIEVPVRASSRRKFSD